MPKNDTLDMFNKAIKDFRGQLPTLEAAIGAYIVGQKIGWKPLFLIHDKKTIAKYEKILGIHFRDELPEVGDLANKSMAWRAMQKATNYWKAVKGEIAGIRSPEMTK
jgi:hypothetical protein